MQPSFANGLSSRSIASDETNQTNRHQSKHEKDCKKAKSNKTKLTQFKPSYDILLGNNLGQFYHKYYYRCMLYTICAVDYLALDNNGSRLDTQIQSVTLTAQSWV